MLAKSGCAFQLWSQRASQFAARGAARRQLSRSVVLFTRGFVFTWFCFDSDGFVLQVHVVVLRGWTHLDLGVHPRVSADGHLWSCRDLVLLQVRNICPSVSRGEGCCGKGGGDPRLSVDWSCGHLVFLQVCTEDQVGWGWGFGLVGRGGGDFILHCQHFVASPLGTSRQTERGPVL